MAAITESLEIAFIPPRSTISDGNNMVGHLAERNFAVVAAGSTEWLFVPVAPARLPPAI